MQPFIQYVFSQEWIFIVIHSKVELFLLQMFCAIDCDTCNYQKKVPTAFAVTGLIMWWIVWQMFIFSEFSMRQKKIWILKSFLDNLLIFSALQNHLASSPFGSVKQNIISPVFIRAYYMRIYFLYRCKAVVITE